MVKNMKDQDSYLFTHLFVKENVYDLHYWSEQNEKKNSNDSQEHERSG